MHKKYLLFLRYKIQPKEKILPPQPWLRLYQLLFLQQTFRAGIPVLERQVIPHILHTVTQQMKLVLFKKPPPRRQAADVFIAYQYILLQLIIPKGNDALIAPVFVELYALYDVISILLHRQDFPTFSQAVMKYLQCLIYRF